jgi:hypothetical protein
MYSQYDFSAGEPMLAPDDVAAICNAYPNLRFDPVCEPQPHRGYAADCGGDVEGGCATELARRTSGAASALVLLLLLVHILLLRARVLRKAA